MKNLTHPNHFIISTLFLLGYSGISHATVGGGQSIEILGYEPKDKKVYILRDFEDARGRTPQLYYYDLKSNDPTQLIEVKSIYLDPTSGKPDYDNRWDEVTRSIDQIKSRLQPLTPLSSMHLNIKSIQKIQSVPSWYDPEVPMRQYQYQYTVTGGNLSSSPQKAISYKAGLDIQQAYKIPYQDKILVTIKYLAFPEETGYTNEDVVMLQPHQ